jgi:peptide-methionine (R)-S-oxide reductase
MYGTIPYTWGNKLKTAQLLGKDFMSDVCTQCKMKRAIRSSTISTSPHDLNSKHSPREYLDSLADRDLSNVNTNNNGDNDNNVNPSLAEYNKKEFLKGSNLGSVINLSNFQLTPSMISLLSKGLNFCPTPGQPEKFQLRQDLDKFHVSLRRKQFFEKRSDSTQPNQLEANIPEETSSSEEQGPFDHFKFRNRSTWNPTGAFQLEAFIALNETRLNEYRFPTPSQSNLSYKERAALAELKKANNIIIKPADKESAVVIQDLVDYIDEGLRQLSDTNFYVETSDDLTHLHNELINNLINYLEENQEISKKCGAYLRNTNPRTSQLYLLPKVHKNKLPMPGRPIVSANNSPTEKISEVADFFLKPLVQNTRSYVRDTTDFINKLERLPTLTPGSYLCTVDVTSLYTNIPNDEGIHACHNILNKFRLGLNTPSNNNIIRLLEHVLYMNNFDFNGKHYLQVGGTAMGTRVAPSFANIFMADFEEKWVYTYPTKPLIWFRYIDDIFMIWDHDKNSLDTFLDHLNSCHHSIKFTSEVSQTNLSFLDTMVHIDHTGTLYTDLYCKPTDAHNYLLFNSAHPHHLVKSLPYSQLLRVRRICSRLQDYDKNAIMIGQHFIRRGYPEDLIESEIIRARRMDRNLLLQDKPQTSQSKSFDETFVITQYNPSCTPLKEIITKNWSLLGRTNTTDSLFENNPIYGYRRNQNLKDDLVHAKITPSPTPDSLIKRRKAERKCKSKNCRYCPRLETTGSIPSTSGDHIYPTRTDITCNSNNLIYCIKCRKCNILYVGQTKNSIKERFKSHFYSITHPHNLDTTVGRHFSHRSHQGIEDTKILVLEFILAPPNTTAAQRLRDEKEKMWIHRLSTIAPLGLNSAD